MKIQDYSKTQKIFTKILMGIFIIMTALEVGMFFVLKSTNQMEETILEYLWLYLIKPFATNAAILIIGYIGIKHISDEDKKGIINIIMLILMCLNMCWVHRVFFVGLLVFCLPVYLTVAFQSKKLLNIVTIVCEILIVALSIYNIIVAERQSKYEYYIQSIIIIMIIVYGCRYTALHTIELLNQKTEALELAVAAATEARHQAEASNQSKSVFLSNMSHEIRTPINAVLGMDEMILRESKEDETLGYAADIKSSGEALLAIINDILDFSKIESGKMELVVGDYSTYDLLHTLDTMIRSRISEKGLQFNVKVDGTMPVGLRGDEVRLRQILINLLTNATKYTDKGFVTFKAIGNKLDDKRCELTFEVVDTGRGIKKEDIEKLFAPFERIEESKSRNVEGTGLGMSITKQLLALMGSELEVRSIYGEGSSFSFRVIQEVTDWTEIGSYNENIREEKTLKKEYRAAFEAPEAKILIVDDVPLNIKVFKGLLKKTKVQMEYALSGAEGLKMMAEKKYDMVFIDHMMPKMDGVEMLHELKESDGINKDTPAIALTANAIAGSREYYLSEGFDDYLTKPMEVDNLGDCLRRFLPKELIVEVGSVEA